MPKASAMPTVPPCFLSIICGHTLEIRCFEGWGAPVLLHTLFFSPPTMGIDPIGEIVLHIIWIEQLFLDLYPTCFSKCHTCVCLKPVDLSKINAIGEATNSQILSPRYYTLHSLHLSHVCPQPPRRSSVRKPNDAWYGEEWHVNLEHQLLGDIHLYGSVYIW